MPNIVTISVENPDEVLNAGAYGTGALVRLQWSATETGTFADVSGTGSTPTTAVVSGTRSYTAYDPNGDTSTWYRTRYEDSGATRLSDWSAAFQAGDEQGGLICSLYDVQQELGATTSASDDERILDLIRQVGAAIEGYCERWFIPRPLSGTTTYTVHTTYGYCLRIPKGIRSISTLAVATGNQPSTGGTYTTATSTTYYIDPPDMDRSVGWPGTSIEFIPGQGTFFDASFGAQITGSFGWSAVPADIQGVATRAVLRRFIGKGGGAVTAVGPNGTDILLPDLSGADRKTLDWYRAIPVG